MLHAAPWRGRRNNFSASSAERQRTVRNSLLKREMENARTFEECDSLRIRRLGPTPSSCRIAVVLRRLENRANEYFRHERRGQRNVSLRSGLRQDGAVCLAAMRRGWNMTLAGSRHATVSKSLARSNDRCPVSGASPLWTTAGYDDGKFRGSAACHRRHRPVCRLHCISYGSKGIRMRLTRLAIRISRPAHVVPAMQRLH